MMLQHEPWGPGACMSMNLQHMQSCFADAHMLMHDQALLALSQECTQRQTVHSKAPVTARMPVWSSQANGPTITSSPALRRSPLLGRLPLHEQPGIHNAGGYVQPNLKS